MRIESVLQIESDLRVWQCFGSATLAQSINISLQYGFIAAFIEPILSSGWAS